MSKVAVDFFDNLSDLLSFDAYIVIYDRSQYHTVMEAFQDYKYSPEHNFVITWDNKSYEVTYFSRSGKVPYKSIKILRNVLAPYVAKDENGVSQPRGWFMGENGKPQRYTGVSNSMYFSKSEFDTDFSVPFLHMLKMMFLQDSDAVYTSIKSLKTVLNPSEALKEYTSKHFIFEA